MLRWFLSRAARRLPIPAAARTVAKLVLDPQSLRETISHMRFRRDLSAGRVPALTTPLEGDRTARGNALVATIGYMAVLPELGIVRCLEMAGYRPIVLGSRGTWPARFAHVLGHRFIDWDDFLPSAGRAADGASLPDVRSMQQLLALEYEGVRVGRYAASTALRELRVGELDFADRQTRDEVRFRLARAVRFTAAARGVLDDVEPALAVFVDRGYTPQGELFDLCLARGIPGVTWNTGHRSNTLMFKRYTRAIRDMHPSSVSAATWERVRRIPWGAAEEARLRREMERTYASGDWYSEVGTQFGTRSMGAEELRASLGLRPGRKVAVIFPHIVWDGTFFWGTDLFGSYERWLAETVRAAVANPSVEWLVKIHPANLIKDARDGVGGVPADERCIREAVGALPDHVRLIPADSPVSTISFYGVADYALTVRGTVGIEAATFGIPVLTAGTGRYDRLGFTIDHDTREAYLERIRRIHEVPRLLPEQTLLARRYAYAVFVLRTLPLQAMTWEFRQDRVASSTPGFRKTSMSDWGASPDVRGIVAWLRSGDEDLLADPLEEARANEPARTLAATAAPGA